MFHQPGFSWNFRGFPLRNHHLGYNLTWPDPFSRKKTQRTTFPKTFPLMSPANNIGGIDFKARHDCTFLCHRGSRITRHEHRKVRPEYIYLEPETSVYKWLFQLDDSKSLYRKRLFTKHPFKTGCLGYQVWKIYLSEWQIHGPKRRADILLRMSSAASRCIERRKNP